MAYYFYKTSEQLENKVQDLEKELSLMENRISDIGKQILSEEEVFDMQSDLKLLQRKIRYFQSALSKKLSLHENTSS